METTQIDHFVNNMILLITRPFCEQDDTPTFMSSIETAQLDHSVKTTTCLRL